VQNSVYEVRGSDLDLVLQPGEYWIGLTPICQSESHGQAGHLVVGDVHDARFDDAVRSPDGDRGAQPYLRGSDSWAKRLEFFEKNGITGPWKQLWPPCD